MQFVLSSPRNRVISILRKNKQVVRQLCDVLLNILLKHIPVSAKTLRQLKRHRSEIYRLVDRRTSDAQRTQIILQNPSLLRPIIPLLKEVARSFKYEPLYQDVSNNRRRQEIAYAVQTTTVSGQGSNGGSRRRATTKVSSNTNTTTP